MIKMLMIIFLKKLEIRDKINISGFSTKPNQTKEKKLGKKKSNIQNKTKFNKYKTPSN